MPRSHADLPIFQDLPENTVELIKSNCSLLDLEGGVPVIWQGDLVKAAYCIISGEIEIYRLALNGREQILDRMGAGECFNLVPALMENGVNPANVRTLTDSQLYSIPTPYFCKLMLEIPQLGMNVAKYLAARLTHMANLVETLSLYTVRQRLARFLISQADAGAGGSVRWTQSDMANRLGTVREVLGRDLRKMEDEGLLRIEREKILLLDRNNLQKAALGEK